MRERGGAVIVLRGWVGIYVAAGPTNLRKSFEGLSNEVRTLLRADPLSGHLFLFLNRPRTQVKMIMWTRGGFTIVHKRLERGRFTFPSAVTSGAASIEVDAHELAMLLEGLALATQPSATRWEPALRPGSAKPLDAALP
jgi:transposase